MSHLSNDPGRILTPAATDALASRCRQFGNLSPRELEIYLAGQSDGMSIKADEVQPVVTRLEFLIGGFPASV